MTTIIDVEQRVQEYLASFLEESSSSAKPHELDKQSSPEQPFDRVVCCKSSQSLYCKECCRLLVPEHLLPSSLRKMKLPFNLHVILDDRRNRGTGLHAVALLNERNIDSSVENINCTDQNSCKKDCSAGNTDANSSNASLDSGAVKLIDVANHDEIPKYQLSADTTFLLFPSPGESVPLESVASKVETLVVLDCKWTKSTISRKDPVLKQLQKVHLSSPPEESYYWRWHNHGKGMLSTIEAVFYAAFEVSQQKNQYLLESNQTLLKMNSKDLMDENNLIHLLWLFGQQRAATLKTAQKAGKPAPCSDEGKEMKRESRKQKGTWRQLRHEEDERILREKKEKILQKKEKKAGKRIL